MRWFVSLKLVWYRFRCGWVVSVNVFLSVMLCWFVLLCVWLMVCSVIVGCWGVINSMSNVVCWLMCWCSNFVIFKIYQKFLLFCWMLIVWYVLLYVRSKWMLVGSIFLRWFVEIMYDFGNCFYVFCVGCLV